MNHPSWLLLLALPAMAWVWHRRAGRKYALVAGALLALLAVTLGQTTPNAPFATTPTVVGYDYPGETIYVRQPVTGAYVQLRFGAFAPFGLLSSSASLAQVISGSVKFSMNAPASPAGVGPASQFLALADFTGDGSPGIALAGQAGRNYSSLTINEYTTSFLFRSAKTFSIGPNVAGVLAADFNRDGKPDLAVAYQGSTSAGAVDIFLNNGDGTFPNPVQYTAGSAPTSMATLDVNHDGILDLVVADGGNSVGGSNGAVFVLLGKGDGTFATAGSYSAGKNPLCVTIADFNGDGNPDLAVTAADNTVTILSGAGNGTFSRGASFSTGTSPQYIAAGDLNRDGKLDLVVANQRDQNVSIFLGDGKGGFQLRSTYITSYGPNSLILTDFNGDGNLDIIQGMGDARGFGAGYYSYNIDILLGNGDGTFQGAASRTIPGTQTVSTFLAAGDFNGDGKIDAILNDKFGGNLYLFAGSGQGAFQAPVTISALSAGGTQTGPSGAVSGDFNGDGKLDLAVTEEFTGKVAVLLNSATGLQLSGTFPSNGAAPGGIVAADFNGDGKLDLAVVNAPSDDRATAGNLTVFLGGGNGAFQLARTYSAGSLPTGVAVADLNGDGKPDLVVTDRSDPFVTPRAAGAVYVFLNDGKGGFQTPLKLATGAYPFSVSVGDLNGDGKPDLVVASEDASVRYTLAIFLGTGSGGFQPATLVSTSYGPSGIAIQDFNGDGKADLVVSHCCGDTDMTYLQGNGDGTFVPEVHFNGGGNSFAVAVSDLNGDGKPDLLIAGTSPPSLTALLNNTAALATPQITLAGIGNAANYVAGKVSAGEIIVVYGLNFGPAALAQLHYTNGIADTTVGNTGIYFDNVAAPMIYAVAGSPGVLSCVVPYGVAGKTSTQVQVEYNGVKGNTLTVPVVDAVPGIFSMNQSGTGPGAILNWPDYTINTSTNRVAAGGYIMIYATGEGKTDIAIDGQRVPLLEPYPRPLLTPWTATVGGKTATVIYCGAAPDNVAGLFQLNAQIPLDLPTGVYEVVIKAGNFASQVGLTVAVK
jgi:uncharacterized protein (TIGR03437 family)